MPIKFGTDGWRGVIADDFTFRNVRQCAQGAADYLKEAGLAQRGLVVGYDTRFGSDLFAAAVAEVATANGVRTILCDRAAPTPAVTYAVVAGGAGGGVVITASHNPAQWNGIKYKPDYGGSATPEIVAALERLIEAAESKEEVRRSTLDDAQRQGLLTYLDPRPGYLARLATLVDLEAIRRSGLAVVADAMHGAAGGYLAALLSGGAATVTELRGEINPAFPGMAQPEPIAHNLAGLMAAVRERPAAVGLATDGDGDRLGVVDETGRYVNTLSTFALLCLHQLEVLGNRGPLVRSITSTGMVDRLGEIYGVQVFDTPVGFKYLGPVMTEHDALLAGEESGGYAFRGHIPERDGILSALMVLEMMVKTGKSVADLLAMLEEKVGPHHYDRQDLGFREDRRDEILARLRAAAPKSLAGKPVVGIDTRDGFRFLLQGGHWALVRFSGTEPLLRVYAEAESPRAVSRLLAEARVMAGV